MSWRGTRTPMGSIITPGSRGPMRAACPTTSSTCPGMPATSRSLSRATTRHFDQFIQGEPCLREQRGRLMGRNSCRNPWINITTARVSKVLPIAHGQSVEVTADLFNVLNLLNGEWGLVRQMTYCCGDFENAHVMRLLELVGYDPTRGRGVYNVLPVN